MYAYLLFFALAGLPAIFHWRKTRTPTWAAIWLAYVLFIGLRHRVGGDWDGYLIITQRVADGSFIEAVQDQEPLFGALTWLSTRLGTGVYGANLVGAAIFCTGLFAYCSRQESRWLSLAAATPFLVVVAVMSANRQGIAIGIVLFTMARWDNLSLLKRSAGFILAGMFHSSALLLLWMTVMDLRTTKLRKLFLLVVVVSVGLWLLMRSEEAFYRYTTVYVQQPDGVYSPGALLHLLLNLAPAILMMTVLRRRFGKFESWKLLRHLCWMAVGLAMLVPFFSVAAGRMSLYLFPLSTTFVACTPGMFRGAVVRASMRMVCVGALAVVLLMWLGYANTASTYLPYQNALLLPTSSLSLP